MAIVLHEKHGVVAECINLVRLLVLSISRLVHKIRAVKRLIDGLVYRAGPDVLQALGVKTLRPAIKVKDFLPMT